MRAARDRAWRSLAFGDGGGEFAFPVVAVAVVHGPPVVDHSDGVEVRLGLVGAVGVAVERVEVGAQPPGPGAWLGVR